MNASRSTKATARQISRSTSSAIARSVNSASSTVSGTPSGVTMSRRLRQSARNSGAARRAGDKLAEAALEDRGDEEHEHGADRDLGGEPSMHREAVDARVAVREKHLFRHHQPGRAAQEDRGDLGHAVDRDPAEKV